MPNQLSGGQRQRAAIAHHAHRIVKRLDGKIKRDEPNSPITWEQHLAHLNQGEKKD